MSQQQQQENILTSIVALLKRATIEERNIADKRKAILSSVREERMGLKEVKSRQRDVFGKLLENPSQELAKEYKSLLIQEEALRKKISEAVGEDLRNLSYEKKKINAIVKACKVLSVATTVPVATDEDVIKALSLVQALSK